MNKGHRLLRIPSGCRRGIVEAYPELGTPATLPARSNEGPDPEAGVFAFPSVASETTDADHGRIEQRRHWVCHDIDWLKSDRRYPGERTFPGLAAIAMVEATTEHNGRTRHEKRYYISSASLDANAFDAAVRAPSIIENRLQIGRAHGCTSVTNAPHVCR